MSTAKEQAMRRGLWREPPDPAIPEEQWAEALLRGLAARYMPKEIPEGLTYEKAMRDLYGSDS